MISLSDKLLEKAKIVGKMDMSRYRKVTFDKPPPGSAQSRSKRQVGHDPKDEVSQRDLDALEKVLDRLFAHYKIDITFTKHFKDRLNDARNKKQITIEELRSLFQKAHDKAGTKLSKLKDIEAVLVDLQSKVNIPFVLKSTKAGLELVSKTVMRKADFKTKDQKIKVEGMDTEKGKRFEEFISESDSLIENLEPEEFMKHARKAQVLLTRDLMKLFPDQETSCHTGHSAGEYIEVSIYNIPKHASHIDKMNATRCARFMMHLSDDFGNMVPKKKFEWEKLMIRTGSFGKTAVKYRKISDKSPLPASLKLLKWLKANAEQFSM